MHYVLKGMYNTMFAKYSYYLALSMYRKNVLQNKLVTLKSEIFVFAYL